MSKSIYERMARITEALANLHFHASDDAYLWNEDTEKRGGLTRDQYIGQQLALYHLDEIKDLFANALIVRRERSKSE
jgi:hypothetical protein